MNMEKNSNQGFYRVSDFPLVVSLFMHLPIVAVDRTDPKRISFLFEASKELEVLLATYHRREMRVDPLDFYHAMKSVKARLYQE